MKWNASKTVLPVAALLLMGVTGCSTEPEVRTETVEVEVTPDACAEALDAAEALVQGPVMELTDDAVLITGLVPEAYEAGVSGNQQAAQDIINSLNEVAARGELRAAEIERLVEEYNAAAEECRAEKSTV